MKTSFTFEKSGLSVNFKMNSTGDPVSFLWDLGDGNTNDTEDEFQHEYEESGFYIITLTVVYEDPEDPQETIEEVITKTVGVATTDWDPLDTPVTQLFQNFVPPNLEVQEDLVEMIYRKWQLFLQPLVNPEIEYEILHNELYWPPLVNYLIAQLIAYDLIIAAANRYLIGLGIQSDNQLTPGLEIKSTRTGPSEVEWFQGSETWSAIFKEGGVFDALTHQICALAHRLRITLHICEHLSHNPIIPRIYKKPKKTKIDIFKKGKLH